MSDLVTQIKARYEADLRSGFVARNANELPLDYESITPEWLTSVLCAEVPEAKVLALSLGPVDDGSSNRRRISVTYNAPGEALELPKSVFCKASHSLSHRITLGVYGAAHAEVTFYRKVRPQLSLQIPKAVYAAYDPESFNSLIILEDLGPGVRFCSHDTFVTKQEVEKQLDLLAAYHTRFPPEASYFEDALSLQSWPDFFSQCMSLNGREQTNKGFLAAESVIPPTLFSRAPEVWAATVASVELHRRLRPSLLHGDCHLKQWYRTEDGAVGLTDWQACSYGSWGRDVAYMLTTCLEVEDRRLWEKDLLRYYLDRRQQLDQQPISWEGAWKIYRQNMLGALAWWTITLVPPAEAIQDMQPKDATLHFIRRLAHAVDDLDSLSSVN